MILSRHRLPHPYRGLITALWLAIPLLLLGAALISRGISVSLFDVRLLLLILPMCIPAWHAWQEGVDVRRDGVVSRLHLPRFYPYAALARWQYDSAPDKRVLKVWDRVGRTALECRPVLTGFDRLIAHLRERVHESPPRQSAG
jgi:hypothetical protein